MALRKQILTYIFSKGLEQDTHPHLMTKGLLRLENARWDRGKEIRKRHGLTTLTGTYAVDWWLSSYKDRPVLFGGGYVKTFAGAAFNDGSFQTSDTQQIGSIAFEQLESRNQIKYASLQEVGTVRCVTYEEVDQGTTPTATRTYWIRTYDTRNNQLLDSWSSSGAVDGGIRCCYTGTKLRVIYTVSGGAIYWRDINTSTGAIGSATALTAVCDPDYPMDCCAMGGTGTPLFIIAVDGGASGDALLITLDDSDVEISTTIALTDCRRVGCCQMTAGTVIAMYYDTASAPKVVKCSGWDRALAAATVSEDTLWSHASRTIDAVSAGAIGSTQITAAFTVADGSATTGQHSRWVETNTYTNSGGTGTAGTAALFKMGCALCAKPLWDTVTGNIFIPLYCYLAGSDQQQYILVRDSGVVAARFRYGYAVASGLHMGLCQSANYQWRIALPSRVSQDVWGLCVVEFNSVVLTPQPKTVETKDHLLFGHALPQVFDGRAVMEHGFMWHPPVIYAVAVAGGSMPEQAYGYTATYEEVDEQGCLHRSPAAPLVTVTFAAPNLQATIDVPTLGVTSRSKVRIVLWRTLQNGNLLYRVADKANDATAQYVQFADNLADATLATHATLYSEGGIKEAVPPHPYTVACLHQGRLCYAPTEWQNSRVYFGKPSEVGVAPELAGEFYIEVPPEGGDILALASFLDRLLIFKRSRIYAVDGTAVDATGYGRGFSEALLVAEGVGCSSQHTVVQVPQGLAFLAADGFWLLDSTLKLNPIGQDCKYLTDNYTYTHGVVVPDLHQAIWFSSTGPAVVFDWLRSCWASYTNHEAKGAVVSFGGKVYHKSALTTTVKVQDSSTHRDGSSAVAMKVRPPWFSFADPLGWFRVYEIMPIGQRVDPHLLRMKTAFNMDPVWVDNQTHGSEVEMVETAVSGLGTDTVDDFGRSVSIDGDWAVVGAPYEDVSGTASVGAIWIYHRVNGSWTIHQTIKGSNGVNSWFGGCVSISGSRIAILEPKSGAGAGAMKIYFATKNSSDVWALDGAQTITAAAGYVFQAPGGKTMVLDGDDLVVASMLNATSEIGAHVYNYVASWTSQGFSTTGLTTGANVAADIDSANNRIILGVGAYTGGLSAQGRAWTFTRSGAVWSAEQTLDPPVPEASGRFGCSVRVLGDTIAVGAYGEGTAGQAHVFLYTTTWALQQTLAGAAAGDVFGVDLDLGTDILAVGAYSMGTSGGVVLFQRSEAVWIQSHSQECSATSTKQYCGSSVCLSGGTILAGGPGYSLGLPAGAAYFYVPEGLCFDTPEHYGAGLTVDYQDQAYMVQFGTSRQKLTSVLVELTDEALSGQALIEGFALTGIAFLVGVKTGMYPPGEARRV